MSYTLVVDSDRRSAEFVSNELQRQEVRHAKTAARATSLIRRRRPRLVFLECVLPDASGLALLGQIKAHLPDVHVVMMSMYRSDWIRRVAIDAGAVECITKPIEPAAFRQLVEHVFPEDPLFTQGRCARVSSDQALISRLTAFIESHYEEPLSLTRVSCYVGLSAFSLCRKFHRVRGVTFRNYLLHLRIKKSLELLATGPHTITEIAQIVGFGDLPRFDKVFKRITGLTPAAYRRTSRGKAASALASPKLHLKQGAGS